MAKKLFLLDGMALVYRAHFALAARPIYTSKGVNTSALYGFTQTLLEILRTQQPTHLAVAFDTDAPTQRHADFPDYKATRQAMPEDLSQALPHVRRMIQAFQIPVLECDGYEADDIIGTAVKRAEKEGFQSFMVTPDKDFGQLISETTFLYKPSRMGDGVEVLGLPEIKLRWGIERPEQVIDILALMGDSSDNIPGVPGIGEKTAIKLIAQFGTVENLLAHAAELTGRVKTSLEEHRQDALLSKKLATIVCDAPCKLDLEALKLKPPLEDEVKGLCVEFEFNSIGRRLFGEEFKAGRGTPVASIPSAPQGEPETARVQPQAESPTPRANLKSSKDLPITVHLVSTQSARTELFQALSTHSQIGIHLSFRGSEVKDARPTGLAFSVQPQEGWYIPFSEQAGMKAVLTEAQSLFQSPEIEFIGHDLKFLLGAARWHGVHLRPRVFDVMVAHSLLEPDMRHSLEYLAEAYLGYTPKASSTSEGQPEQLALSTVAPEQVAEAAVEAAELNLQLRALFQPLLGQKGQERVFHEIESPLIGVLADMEFAGIKVDATTLADFATELGREIEQLGNRICGLAGTTFNLNSPKQLGQILFDVMKICEAPKKTRTGQYATDEQTLASLATDHEIVQLLLDHRAASKLKSTYADALPLAIDPKTKRIHTTYNQVMTSTGRLNSQNPNLQNIPIRTERGQEIRKAFVPGQPGWKLLSADYSQIELRILAGLSREAGLLEAFRSNADVHTATAAKVYGVFPEMVTAEMRRKAKMVNYGIAYGISAFGLAQRLRIPRKEGAQIIEQYFAQFPGIRGYMEQTVASARKNGYVETVTGRRRYIRDITSSNATVRSAAERNAINAPIQGTAADMIKLAMVNIQRELLRRKLQSRMLLQVHDELVFEIPAAEESEVRALVEDLMKNAIEVGVPIVVEIGSGATWLEAH